MNITHRLLSAFGFSLLGALLGFGGGFVVLVFTVNDYGLLPLIGGVVTGVFALLGFFGAAGVPASGPATSGADDSDERTGRDRQRALWGKAVGDAVSKPQSFNDDSRF